MLRYFSYIGNHVPGEGYGDLISFRDKRDWLRDCANQGGLDTRKTPQNLRVEPVSHVILVSAYVRAGCANWHLCVMTLVVSTVGREIERPWKCTENKNFIAQLNQWVIIYYYYLYQAVPTDRSLFTGCPKWLRRCMRNAGWEQTQRMRGGSEFHSLVAV